MKSLKRVLLFFLLGMQYAICYTGPFQANFPMLVQKQDGAIRMIDHDKIYLNQDRLFIHSNGIQLETDLSSKYYLDHICHDQKGYFFRFNLPNASKNNEKFFSNASKMIFFQDEIYIQNSYNQWLPAEEILVGQFFSREPTCPRGHTGIIRVRGTWYCMEDGCPYFFGNIKRGRG